MSTRVTRAGIRLAAPQSGNDWRRARGLIEEYAASLGVDLCFQNLAHELEHLGEEYGPPSGAFLLAARAGVLVGCAGLRRFAEDTAEMKRLYVVPAARGLGVGRLLAAGIVSAAKRLGYARVLLDTLASMQEARSLYESLGFVPIAAYRYNPLPGTQYLELKLG